MQNNKTYPIEYAGSESDGPKVDYKSKYAQQQQVIRDNFAHFGVPYNGADNNDYVDGRGFSETDGSLEGAMLFRSRVHLDNLQRLCSFNIEGVHAVADKTYVAHQISCKFK